MTCSNRDSTYACIGYEHSVCPKEIRDRSILVDADIAETLDLALRSRRTAQMPVRSPAPV